MSSWWYLRTGEDAYISDGIPTHGVVYTLEATKDSVLPVQTQHHNGFPRSRARLGGRIADRKHNVLKQALRAASHAQQELPWPPLSCTFHQPSSRTG
jgi:hypothetical protein